MKPKPKPDEFDALVGKNLFAVRSVRGVSQKQLAEAIGVSFQQVQKYEKGVNRISAVRLYKASKYLKADLLQFFEEKGQKSNSDNVDFLTLDKQTLEMVRAFEKINDKKLRRNFLNIFKYLNC
jgi:transcriptional regulator with XRE-family HTH domain